MTPTPGSYEHRFSGLQRLYGKSRHSKLKHAHICVVGIGGVGSWVVEALARSGIQEITMIDWDDLCYTNINRQIHAMDGTIGKAKIDIMSERIKAINPECNIHAIREYFSPDNAEILLSNTFQGVIDAIDVLTPKCHLLAGCRRLKIPIVAMGAAGGMVDPTLIKVADLNKSYQDPLLAQVRKKLKRDYNFPSKENARFKIPCIFSSEHKTIPKPEEIDCALDDLDKSSKNLGCDYGYGSATFVTGSMAFFAVAHLFKMLLRKP